MLSLEKNMVKWFLCADAADPWRRDMLPNYKHQRRKGK